MRKTMLELWYQRDVMNDLKSLHKCNSCIGFIMCKQTLKALTIARECVHKLQHGRCCSVVGICINRIRVVYRK